MHRVAVASFSEAPASETGCSLRKAHVKVHTEGSRGSLIANPLCLIGCSSFPKMLLKNFTHNDGHEHGHCFEHMLQPSLIASQGEHTRVSVEIVEGVHKNSHSTGWLFPLEETLFAAECEFGLICNGS